MQPPAAGGRPRSVVVLLHGASGIGADLMGCVPAWAGALPHTEFVAPDAPEPNDLGPIGRQWFSKRDHSLLGMIRGVATGARRLDEFLDEILAARGLDDRRMALLGFSQGAMIALHVGLRRATAPAAIVGYAGMLLAGPELVAEIRARPPVLLVHGDQDPILPVGALDAAAIALRAVGVAVEIERRPGLGHAIDAVGFERGASFLAAALTDGAPAA